MHYPHRRPPTMLENEAALRRRNKRQAGASNRRTLMLGQHPLCETRTSMTRKQGIGANRDYHTNNYKRLVLICLLVFFSSSVPAVFASTPDTILTINDEEWLVKRASFGNENKQDGGLTGKLMLSTSVIPNDPFLCGADFITSSGQPTITNTTFGALDNIVQQTKDSILLVPRGNCIFDFKVSLAQKVYQASVILVYDSLQARYRWNDTSKQIDFPLDLFDYDCEQGAGSVSIAQPLNRSELYDSATWDPIFDQQSTAAAATTCVLEPSRRPCESQLCLITSAPPNSSSPTSSAIDYPVCCAWDLPLTMPALAPEGDFSTEEIVAVFLTIRQTQDIMTILESSNTGTVTATVQRRPLPPFNVSMIFLWALGTFVTFLASWHSTKDYRLFDAKYDDYRAKRQQDRANDNNDDENPTNSNDNTELDQYIVSLEDLVENEGSRNDDDRGDANDNDTPATKSNTKTRKKWPQKKKNQTLQSLPPSFPESETGDIEMPNAKKTEEAIFSWTRPGYREETKQEHVDKNPPISILQSVSPSKANRKRQLSKGGSRAQQQRGTNNSTGYSGFIPDAAVTRPSFEMTSYHVAGFVVLASAMLLLLFFFRFYSVITVLYGFGCSGAVSYLIFSPFLTWLVPKFGDGWVRELNKPIVCGQNGFDVTSQLVGLVWAIVWLWYGLSHYRPSRNAFFWITIDIFGACFCILALHTMRLNNMKIATLLMVAIFIYDIFFVFITPLFMNGESVMITVAKGGASSGNTGDDFCIKYPDDRRCTGIDFLPMLLIIPRLNDYTSGSVLLGLGDIVLPGYLIAFAARTDQAARILAKHTKVEVTAPERWYQGYFFPLMVSYGFGLFLAYLAFGLTELGQPALLYLCPCCLGTMFFLGRNELKDLWADGRVVRVTDKFIYKCERFWGRERMRRLVAKKKQERATLEGLGESAATPVTQQSRSPSRGQRKNQQERESNRDEHKKGVTGNEVRPQRDDVCFGDFSHPGTKHLKVIISRVASSQNNADFSPDVYKLIRNDTKGRRFFVRDKTGGWLEASKIATRNMIGKEYRRAQSK